MVLAAVLGAIAVGWIYQSRSKDTLATARLEIPTDIDFFMSQMDYRAFNESGNLDYQLQSPYLEHFIKDDISHLKQPVMFVYRATGNWRLKSMRGDIFHQQDWLQLDESVVMQKMGKNPILVRSESMLFKPEQDLVTIEDTVIIESGSAKISGENAIFDLAQEVYLLENTRAIYHHADI